MNNNLLESVTHYTGTKKKPIVALIGGVHGNEPMGVKILEALQSELDKAVTGTLYLIVGNPLAYAKKKRYIDTDLNRLFGNKLSHAKLYEEKRAQEISPILKEADFVIDIHSTIKPSIPFMYCKKSAEHLSLAQLFQPKYIVSPLPDFETTFSHMCIDNYTDTHGGIGMTYETGWQQDASNFYHAFSMVKKFLSYVGAASFTLQKNDYSHRTTPKKAPVFLNLYKEIIPATDSFGFPTNVSNFDFIKKGSVYATDGKRPLFAEKDSYIIFPKYACIKGKPACYLACKQ